MEYSFSRALNFIAIALGKFGSPTTPFHYALKNNKGQKSMFSSCSSIECARWFRELMFCKPDLAQKMGAMNYIFHAFLRALCRFKCLFYLNELVVFQCKFISTSMNRRDRLKTVKIMNKTTHQQSMKSLYECIFKFWIILYLEECLSAYKIWLTCSSTQKIVTRQYNFLRQCLS